MALGTDELKQRILPGILRGEVHFAIGYTEPTAGTDLDLAVTLETAHRNHVHSPMSATRPSVTGRRWVRQHNSRPIAAAQRNGPGPRSTFLGTRAAPGQVTGLDPTIDVDRPFQERAESNKEPAAVEIRARMSMSADGFVTTPEGWHHGVPRRMRGSVDGSDDVRAGPEQ